MYERTLEGMWEVFGDYLDGEYQSLVCVVSTAALGETATAALQSTFARLGYGRAACTFFVLQGRTSSQTAIPKASSEQPAENTPDNVLALAEEEFYTVLEGIDPLIVVIADESARNVCAKAYRQEIPAKQRCRILGREVRAFDSFEKMLANEKGKIEAWALLKTLPKYEA